MSGILPIHKISPRDHHYAWRDSRNSRLTSSSLAYAQLYITLAAIIRRFDLQLFETSLADVEPSNDGIVALAKEGSKVQMLVLGVHQGS